MPGVANSGVVGAGHGSGAAGVGTSDLEAGTDFFKTAGPVSLSGLAGCFAADSETFALALCKAPAKAAAPGSTGLPEAPGLLCGFGNTTSSWIEDAVTALLTAGSARPRFEKHSAHQTADSIVRRAPKPGSLWKAKRNRSDRISGSSAWVAGELGFRVMLAHCSGQDLAARTAGEQQIVETTLPAPVLLLAVERELIFAQDLQRLAFLPGLPEICGPGVAQPLHFRELGLQTTLPLQKNRAAEQIKLEFRRTQPALEVPRFSGFACCDFSTEIVELPCQGRDAMVRGLQGQLPLTLQAAP